MIKLIQETLFAVSNSVGYKWNVYDKIELGSLKCFVSKSSFIAPINCTPLWVALWWYSRLRGDCPLQACLNFLLAKGVAVEEIRADEIHEGNMKAGETPGHTHLSTNTDMNTIIHDERVHAFKHWQLWSHLDSFSERPHLPSNLLLSPGAGGEFICVHVNSE